MKIATKYEMANKQDMLIHRIQLGEKIATWSVQDSNYSDDLFNGSYSQCVKEAKRMYHAGLDVVGIALIELDSNLCFEYCYQFISVNDFL